MITVLCVAGAVLIGFALVIAFLVWLKVRAARADPEHAEHD